MSNQKRARTHPTQMMLDDGLRPPLRTDISGLLSSLGEITNHEPADTSLPMIPRAVQHAQAIYQETSANIAENGRIVTYVNAWQILIEE